MAHACGNRHELLLSGRGIGRLVRLVTGSAEMTWLNGWSTAATFEGEFSHVTRSYKGVVRYAWRAAGRRGRFQNTSLSFPLKTVSIRNNY